MYIKKEMTPYDFLKEESWECQDLLEALDSESMIETFNTYVEESFNGEIPTKGQLNDFLRFSSEEILKSLGYDEDEEE